MSVITIPTWTRPDFLADYTPEQIYEVMKQTDIGNGRTIADVFATEQGSMFYDLCYPSAIAKSLMITEQFDLALQAAFPQYAYGSFLDLHGATYGITRLQATAATVTLSFTGTTGTSIPLGSVFGTIPDANGFSVKFTTDAILTLAAGAGTVTATSSTTGANQNVVAGTVTNLLAAMAGLTAVTNPLPALGGTDIETDTAYRQRILQKTSSEPGAGAVSDYERWAKTVDGVGTAKILSDWNTTYGAGWGAVKILLLSSEGEPVSNTVADNVQGIIWPAERATVTIAVTTDAACELLTTDLFATSGTTPAGIQFKPTANVTIASATTTAVPCEAVEPGLRGNVAINSIDTIVHADAHVTGVINSAGAATGGIADYDGLAPFGAVVTVKPYDAVAITYAVSVIYDNTVVSEGTIIETWRDAIQAYYETAKADSSNGLVRFNKIMGLLLSIEGVRDATVYSIDVDGTVQATTPLGSYALGIDEYPVTADIQLMWHIPFLVETSAHAPISGVTIIDKTGTVIDTTDASGLADAYVETARHTFTFQHASYTTESITLDVNGADIPVADATVTMTAV